MRNVLCCLTVLFLFSCGGNGENVSGNMTSVDTAHAVGEVPQNGLAEGLQTFDKLPAAIEGCSGLYVSDTSSLSSGAYIFASDLQGKAFIKWGNEVIELDRIRNIEDTAFGIRELYLNGEFEVEIKAKKSKNLGEELSEFRGMLIIRKGEMRETYGVIGEVGC